MENFFFLAFFQKFTNQNEKQDVIVLHINCANEYWGSGVAGFELKRFIPPIFSLLM
jgi:hypothetical protein